MLAIVVSAPRTSKIINCEAPEPAPEQIRLSVEGCGVCASNLIPWGGAEWVDFPLQPGALGHEAYGTIDAIGEGVTGLTPGDRVAALSYRSYAQYDLAEADAVLKLPDELANKPFPGEPFACAMNIFQRSKVESGQTVAIIGIGFLGALLTQLASREGARVIAISRRDFSLQAAEEAGAAHCVRMDDHWRIIEEIKTLTGGEFCDCVIEAVGAQWPLDLAAELTKIRGRLVIAGYHQDGPRSINMQLWNWRGLDVINAHERDPKLYMSGMRAALDRLMAGGFDPWPLFTHTLPLHDLDKALTMTRDRPHGFIKAIVTP